jgi:uncharacterized membrane protein YjjP (DUF1212 family)
MEYKVEEILDVAMEIGVNLLQCGAEIRRVEETITYICKAYGASEVDVFAIPSLIISTIVVEGQTYTTKIKRNLDVTTDLFRLEKYNKLSRKICKEKPSLVEVKEEVNAIKNLKDYNIFLLYLGAILSAGGFAMFFGGTIRDGLAAGLVSIPMFMFLRLQKKTFNQFVHTLICALIGGFFSVVACWLGLAENLSYVMSGAIMIIIPGLAIGTSIRDIMSNDVLSGSVRLFQAVVSSMAIAAGFSVFAHLYSGPVEMNNTVEWWSVLITSFISTCGFAIFFNNKYKHLPIVSVCGVISCAVYFFTDLAINNLFISVMLGSMVATFMAEVLARVLKSPATVFLIPAIIPFVPGATLFFMMYNLINGNVSEFYIKFTDLDKLWQAVGAEIFWRL